eukprot:TRINITY_DN20084_c0_g1_i2.p1 TRINITY_DN20084_c0_g1~~TRINITY_DN20084_c0_g1_i2.p1  ORF type:complete len:986 (+),score=240.78 TRINITY_DN20084_c0_g1_i2:28-2985(+)
MVNGSTDTQSNERPIPDTKEFKRAVLSWDFYKDIRDEILQVQEEEAVALAQLGDVLLSQDEVEELLMPIQGLSPDEQKKKLKLREQRRRQTERLPPNERELELQQWQQSARKKKAKRLAEERVNELARAEGMIEVPLHFQDESEYLSAFKPLFFREARSQIQRCKFSEMDKESEVVEHHAFRLDGDFMKLEFRRSGQESKQKLYGQNDLLLLSQGEDPFQPELAHMLALVDHSVATMVTCTVHIDASAAKGSRMAEVAKVISQSGSWRLVKVTSLATLIREFEGLQALPHIFLKNTILNGEESRNDAGTEMQAASALENAASSSRVTGSTSDELLHIPPAIERWIESRYNKSQQQAIHDSRKVSGITLVQGPPGTGKTTTVLGILAVLLNAKASETKAVSYTKGGHASADAEASTEEGDSEVDEAQLEIERQKRLKRLCTARWMRPGYVAWTDAEAQEVSMPGSAAARLPYPKIRSNAIFSMSEIREDVTPQKVLVCAPSNAAVDEVMRRIDKDGIIDANGQPKTPAMLRLGPNAHRSVQKYSLENLVKERLNAMTEMSDLNQQENEKLKLMRNCRIMCMTLSISGHRDMVGFPDDFDTVVIDEASQGVEVSTLVPLKLGCRRLILVGDPQQLPATCFSETAKLHMYERSLFQRLQMSQYKVNMLNTQYRMHPAISSFPSKRFYDGKLANVREKEEFERDFPAEWSFLPCFGPVAFFNIKGEHRTEMQSLVNEAEAEFVIHLFKTISALFPDQNWKQKLAVVSPYAEQVGFIRARFRELFNLGMKDPSPVEVNTVDGFQGREKDCIVVSCVRGACDSKSIGFVKDKRRMNVAFTRARLNLWVVGHAEVLGRNDDWKAFINEQSDECRCLRVSQPFDTFLPRYLNSWYARHPDVEKPSSKIFDVEEISEADRVDEKPSFTISEEELERLREEEEERLRQERDIEEVSNGIGGAGSDLETEPLETAEEAPLKKRKLQQDDQEPAANE